MQANNNNKEKKRKEKNNDLENQNNVSRCYRAKNKRIFEYLISFYCHPFLRSPPSNIV